MDKTLAATLALFLSFAAPAPALQGSTLGARLARRPELRGPLFSPVQLSFSCTTHPLDVDGDGRPELVEACGGLRVTKLGPDLAPVAQQFLARPGVSAGTFADFDADGDLDVVLVDPTIPASVELFRNRGTGVFDPAGAYPVLSPAFVVISGDWDGDGDQDLATLQSNGRIGTYLNKGNGTFDGPVAHIVGLGASIFNNGPLTAGDLDGDGLDDLVVVNAASLYVVRSRGDDGWANAVRQPTTGVPQTFRLVDLDRDERIDLLVLTDKSRIELSWGNGDGSFAAPIPSLLAPVMGSFFDLWDLDRDGDLDLVAGTTNGVTVFDGDGNGAFVERRVLPDSYGSHVQLADLDGDGRPEILAGSSVVPGAATPGNEFPRQVVSAGTAKPALQPDVADMDGDGFADAVILTPSPSLGMAVGDEVTVFRNQGDGRLVEASSQASDRIVGGRLGDVDGDGDQDVLCYTADDVVDVLANDGSGALARAQPYPAGADPAALVLGDWDGDGDPDLALPTPSTLRTSVLFNDGSGGFLQSAQVAPGVTACWIEAGDVDGDGDLDLVLLEEALGRVRWLANDGAGGFASAGIVSVGAEPVSITAADVDLDGDLDLVVPDQVEEALSVLRGDGAGAFALERIPATSGPMFVAVADLDEDGWPDLVAALRWRLGFSVHCGTGAGFESPKAFASIWLPQTCAVADLDRDGHLDVALMLQHNKYVATVHLNRLPLH